MVGRYSTSPTALRKVAVYREAHQGDSLYKGRLK